MSKDRLSDIWGRFGAGTKTNADFSGTSVENTIRPERQDRPRFIPPEEAARREAEDKRGRGREAGVVDPVAAALSAMQAKLDEKPGRGRKAPPPPISMPEDGIAATVLADIKATEARTARRDGDYIAYAAARQAAWKRRKRKKFLGIF